MEGGENVSRETLKQPLRRNTVAAPPPGLLRSPTQGRLGFVQAPLEIHRNSGAWQHHLIFKGSLVQRELAVKPPEGLFSFYNPSDTATAIHHPRVCYAAPHRGGF